jgi:hypothetical protein
MIDVVFTLDYEIYGKGSGDLRELVIKPTERLRGLFKKHGATFVVFAEAAEFEKIEESSADHTINEVRAQLRQLYQAGFEIGLHLHPQWYNGRREGGKWVLDSAEYSLCWLPEERIDELVSRSIRYLRSVLEDPEFVPTSFRAGNWLLQPTATVARVLYRHGIRLDSSVFKGGLQRRHGLDYRPALKNGHYWSFTDDVNKPDSSGILLEIPIHSEMVPAWKMVKAKRLVLQRRNMETEDSKGMADRFLDFVRFRYPRKFDFCRMTWEELRKTIDRAVAEDTTSPGLYRPIVAIGHSKDLVDYQGVDKLLGQLVRKQVSVSDFRTVSARLAKAGLELSTHRIG